MKVSKKNTLFSLSFAGFVLLTLPQAGKAFELKEDWAFKGGIRYENGKVSKINNGYEVNIKVLDLPSTSAIEWTVRLNGEKQNTNFLAEERTVSKTEDKGRFLHFYIPYGYRGDIVVEAKSGNEVKTWSTKVVDDVYSDSAKSGYFILDGEQILESSWDSVNESYIATLPTVTSGKTVVAWREEGTLNLIKPGRIVRQYNSSGSYVELSPIFETASWLKSNQNWYYQKQGQLVQNSWIKDQGSWYAFKSSGAMISADWLYDNGSWYYLKDSGSMVTGWLKNGGSWYYLNKSGSMATGWIKDSGTWYYLKNSGSMATGWVKDSGSWYYLKNSGSMATGWVKDNGKWYYLASSGNMLRNTRTPDGYYVDGSGAWK
ncbi:choline binding protein PcpA [Streptococcus pneumoniae]|nr:choline binding protein PcpA [Streptococcus pneumoniae]